MDIRCSAQSVLRKDIYITGLFTYICIYIEPIILSHFCAFVIRTLQMYIWVVSGISYSFSRDRRVLDISLYDQIRALSVQSGMHDDRLRDQ